MKKIIKAFHTASYSPIIIAGWETGGIEFTYKNGNITDIFINKNWAILKLVNHK